jgi:WD40 repeat protein
MFHRLIQLAIIITLCPCTIDAQTLSNCEPSPPMSPNAKPGIGGLTLSRDGKTILVAAGDGKIRFVDLDTAEVKRTLIGHTNMVYVATFSPDEKLLASSSRDRTARTWDVATRPGTAHTGWLSLRG